MIEAKYGMKYHFPHTIIHIVDRSGFNGQTPVVFADDPSVFSTMVVSGFPMGEDGKMIKVARSDIPRVAYGINKITTSDRKKYGQAIEYPTSLIAQGAPVQLMRVTPEDSVYAFETITAKYKWDSVAKLFHVKFLKAHVEPTGAIMSNFKSPEKLAQAIISQNAKLGPGADGWTERVFAVVVAAGRGAVYNNMHLSIDTVNQARNPANAAYVFATLDSRTSDVIEEFTASLVNIDNVDRLDYIETVNNQIAAREAGSSVVKPIINEKCVAEIFEAYMKCYNGEMQTGEYTTDQYTKPIKTLNINTFDMITGKYLYDGGLDVNLPFYQVDAIDTDVPQLSKEYRLYNLEVSHNPDQPADYEVLKNKMIGMAYGINTPGQSVYIGDVYLTTQGSSNSNPRISIVCAINQYSQAVTSVTFDSIYHTMTVKGGTGFIKSKIVKVYDSNTVINTTQLQADGVKPGEMVAQLITGQDGVTITSFTLYPVNADAQDQDVPVLGTAYSMADIIKKLPYEDKYGIENVISIYDGSTTDEKYVKRGFIPGFAVIDKQNGLIYLNSYDVTTSDTAFPGTNGHRDVLGNYSCKFGPVPTKTGAVVDGILDSKYDILSYDAENVNTWENTGAKVTEDHAGSDYAVGDILTVTGSSSNSIKFTVTKITGSSTTGGVAEVVPSDTEGERRVNGDRITGTALDTTTTGSGTGCQLKIEDADWKIAVDSTNTPLVTGNPEEINRYIISNIVGSLYKIEWDRGTVIPNDYYSDDYGINLDAKSGGVQLEGGNAGFLDDPTINEIEFKYRYAAMLTKAFRGQIDPRILSPIRTPAKFLFDAAYNTVVGSAFSTLINHSVSDWINGSVIFTDEEKDEVLFDPSLIKNLSPADLDVKQAMYDLMIERVYDRIPESKRPIGPGSGFSVLFDSCFADGNTSALINNSFNSRFTNPNASWDVGGYTTLDGITYTYAKRSADNLITHCKTYSINKPFTNDYTAMSSSEYVSIFPDIDGDSWEEREDLWNFGGNAWIMDENGTVRRMSQRTMKGDDETSDLIWESNMRTLSQLTYLLRQKIERYLFEYSDDSILKTMKVECENMFSNWVGNIVQSLTIDFERDVNVDGGDIVICTVNVTFRGLIVRVPIIVNVNRRA